MEINLALDAGSPEARRANELARELLTSRALVGHGSDMALFNATLGRVVTEAFEGIEGLEEFEGLEDLSQRVGYLIAALATVGAAAVWTAAKAFEAVELGDAEKTSLDDIPEEHIRQVLETISKYMASHPSGL
jgi:hypothetical protein